MDDRVATTDGEMSTGLQGLVVYDSDGEKVGTVQDDSAPHSMTVQKGWLFPQDIRVPRTAVAGIDADGVHLNLPKDDLQHTRWAQTPDQEAAQEHSAGLAPARRGAGEPATQRALIGPSAYEARVVVEDAPIEDGLTAARAAFVERDIDVPVMAETLTVRKRAVVKEEFWLRKDVVVERRLVSGVVRKERVTVEGAENGAETT